MCLLDWCVRFAAFAEDAMAENNNIVGSREQLASQTRQARAQITTTTIETELSSSPIANH